MKRTLAFLYGIGGFLAAGAVILYAIAFVGDFAVPYTIDSGRSAPLGAAVVIDVLLLGLFAVQHSGMARQGFKRAWTRLISPFVERSTYVWIASAILALIFWQWRPIPAVIWEVDNAIGAGVLWALFALGWVTVFVSIVLIDPFELFGLRQVHAYFRRKPVEHVSFKTPGLYKMVRHPLYLGFVIAFWSTPLMTAGHLLFAVATTGYILIAIRFEERDLTRFFGEQYRFYRQHVPMILPWRGKAVDAPPRPESSQR